MAARFIVQVSDDADYKDAVLDAPRGTLCVVDVYASWCGPCDALNKKITNLYQDNTECAAAVGSLAGGRRLLLGTLLGRGGLLALRRGLVAGLERVLGNVCRRVRDRLRLTRRLLGQRVGCGGRLRRVLALPPLLPRELFFGRLLARRRRRWLWRGLLGLLARCRRRRRRPLRRRLRRRGRQVV